MRIYQFNVLFSVTEDQDRMTVTSVRILGRGRDLGRVNDRTVGLNLVRQDPKVKVRSGSIPVLELRSTGIYIMRVNSSRSTLNTCCRHFRRLIFNSVDLS